MKPARYIILNPSGNLTALVTEWGGAEDEAELTARLMHSQKRLQGVYAHRFIRCKVAGELRL